MAVAYGRGMAAIGATLWRNQRGFPGSWERRLHGPISGRRCGVQRIARWWPVPRRPVCPVAGPWLLLDGLGERYGQCMVLQLCEGFARATSSKRRRKGKRLLCSLRQELICQSSRSSVIPVAQADRELPIAAGATAHQASVPLHCLTRQMFHCLYFYLAGVAR